jgi:VanZ family protein
VTPARRGALLAALAVGWAGLLFWESSQANPFPFLPSSLLSHDKLLHLAAYAVLGALLAGALAARLGTGRAVGLAVALAAAYGATDEWHQSYVPGREADPADWAADAAGAVLGASAAALALRRLNARASIRA